MTVLLLVLDLNGVIPKVKRNPNFQYGNITSAVFLFLAVISFIGITELYFELIFSHAKIKRNKISFSYPWMFGAKSAI